MRLKVTTIGLGLISLVLATTAGQTGEKTGLKIGAKGPAFKLKDQTGKERSLDEFLKKDKVALVFYRSATW